MIIDPNASDLATAHMIVNPGINVPSCSWNVPKTCCVLPSPSCKDFTPRRHIKLIQRCLSSTRITKKLRF
jgi:hypothetical protein